MKNHQSVLKHVPIRIIGCSCGWDASQAANPDDAWAAHLADAHLADEAAPAYSLFLLGDVVEHTNLQQQGCLIAFGPRRPDGTTECIVQPARDTRDPDRDLEPTWWNSADVRRVRRRDPFRRYLALVAAEDALAGQERRKSAPNGRRHWARRSRSFGPWLPSAVWEKMYWRLSNQQQHDPSGAYVHWNLGRGAWGVAAGDCLRRRDRAERHWMGPPIQEVPSTFACEAPGGGALGAPLRLTSKESEALRMAHEHVRVHMAHQHRWKVRDAALEAISKALAAANNAPTFRLTPEEIEALSLARAHVRSHMDTQHSWVLRATVLVAIDEVIAVAQSNTGTVKKVDPGNALFEGAPPMNKKEEG